MPFVTDPTWTPSTYRLALTRWQQNAAGKDSEVLPRQAATTSKPRHTALSRKLRALLTWRAMSNGSDWTAVPANDNKPTGEPALIDSDFRIRPSVGEMMNALKPVTFEERRHAKLGGGGDENVVPIGGDVERGPVSPRAMRRKQLAVPCVTRLGTLEFSNGAIEEPALVRDEAGNVVRGSVRIPLGGMTRMGRFRPSERFGAPKGADNDNSPSITAGHSANASAPAFDFVDPVADAQEFERVRQAVKPETANVLDLALRAANFSEIGEHLGHHGKTAERRGKAALLAACEELEAVLAA